MSAAAISARMALQIASDAGLPLERAAAMLERLQPVARWEGAPMYSADAVSRAVRFAMGKARQLELEEFERRAADELAAIPGVGTGRMGLTPDAVKASPEYRAARAAHAAAFQRLQEFNARFVREFRADLAAERRARQSLKRGVTA